MYRLGNKAYGIGQEKKFAQKMRRKCMLWGLVSLCFATAFAQKPDTLRNSKMQQIVVTGTGTHRQQQDAIVPVQVITANDLRKAHVTNMEEALNMLTPNVTFKTNGMGTTLSLNGLSEDYVLILENGHRLTSDDRYTRINMANVKRIEVLSGASSALYGSEAIGGVINIITDDVSRMVKREHVSVTNQVQRSSKGRFHESMAASVQKGAFQSSTQYQRQQAGGWQVNRQEEVLGVLKPTGRLMSQGWHSDQLNQRFSWDFNSGINVYVRGSWQQYETERPQQAKYYKGKVSRTGDTVFTETPAYLCDLRRQNWLYGAGATWRVNKRIYLAADFYADNLDSQRDSFDTFRPGGTQLTKRQHYYNGTLKGIFRLGTWNKLSAGTEYILETYRSYNFSFRNMYTLSLFAQDEMKVLRNLQAVLGLRYIQNERFGAYATPTAGLMYSPGPVRLRASYSTGYRTPTLLQMYYENDETKTVTIGNLDLQPEKSNFYQVGAEYNSHWFSGGITLYRNDLRDMISYRTLTNQEVSALGLDGQYPTATKYQQRDNINKATVKGLHLSAELYLPNNLRLGGAYTLNETRATTHTLDVKTQQYESRHEPVDCSVKHSGTAHASWGRQWKAYRLDVNLQCRMLGRRWSTSYGWAPRHTQLDLNTTHTWTLSHVDLQPGIGIQNLLNKRDTRPWNSNFSTLHPGRCLYASMVVKFNK